MPEEYKGFPEYYAEIIKELWKTSFFEWKIDNINLLESGQICEAVINYDNDKSYYLELFDQVLENEIESTWKIKPLKSRLPMREERLQAFNLETNEHFLLRKSKMRPVILVKKHIDDFGNPQNEVLHITQWIIIPLFTYKKNKHDAEYVLRDQRLQNSIRFYIPPSIETGCRLHCESAARFNLIQCIKESDIKPMRAPNKELGMQKGFKISKPVLKLIIYHYYKSMEILNELDNGPDNIENEYDLFKEVVNEFIDKSIKTT